MMPTPEQCDARRRTLRQHEKDRADRDNRFAKPLGINSAQLRLLAFAVANEGRTWGKGVGTGGRGMTRVALEKRGLIEPMGSGEGCLSRGLITDAGREIVRQARAKGW